MTVVNLNSSENLDSVVEPYVLNIANHAPKVIHVMNDGHAPNG